MKQIAGIAELRDQVEELRRNGRRIGVVPTMGALHEGHLSLVRIARDRSDVVIMTIFVNPTQFAPTEDFASYPRDLQRDADLARSAGADILFVPSDKEVYPQPYQTYVNVEQLTTVLEGKSRPTHFRGVTTVVAKLLNMTTPHVAVFGQKDAQQAAVIRQMAKDLNFPVEIIVGPIVREADGLAMSSRNAYLSGEERAQSPVLSRSIQRAEVLIRGGERESSVIIGDMKTMISAQSLASIDYISVAEYATLRELARLAPGLTVLVSLAVRFGKTRLIDNTIVKVP